MSTYEYLWRVEATSSETLVWAPTKSDAARLFAESNREEIISVERAQGAPRSGPASNAVRYVPPAPDHIRALSDGDLVREAAAAADSGDPAVARYILREINRRRSRRGHYRRRSDPHQSRRGLLP